jgi:hypothetical protein
MQAALFGPGGTEQSLLSVCYRVADFKPTGGCRRVADFNPLAGAFSRVCQALFANPTAEAEARFGDAGAERIRLCQKSLSLPYIVLFDLLSGIIQLYIAV